MLSPSVVDDYAAKVAALVPAPDGGTVSQRRAGLKAVLTPIHGVGDATVRTALSAAGFTDLTSVPEQAEPDPDFPTVAFPNPEEPGAIDLALKLATTIEADVVIANDPDTDRCAVATVIDGDWRMLHGDVVGSLLGERVAAAHARTRGAQHWPTRSCRRASSPRSPSVTVWATPTRSPDSSGSPVRLTWSTATRRRSAIAWRRELVLDKDGVSTAVMIAELVSELKAAWPHPGRCDRRPRAAVRRVPLVSGQRAVRRRLPDSRRS